MRNIFEFELPSEDEEFFETILSHKNVTIKKIVSNTLSTPQHFCDDTKDEWVVVLQGCAKLEMEGEVHKLRKGDSLFIPAKTPHTLIKTKKSVVWLAVYIG